MAARPRVFLLRLRRSHAFGEDAREGEGGWTRTHVLRRRHFLQGPARRWPVEKNDESAVAARAVRVRAAARLLRLRAAARAGNLGEGFSGRKGTHHPARAARSFAAGD